MDNNLYTEIKSLSDKYASELRLKIDERIEEMKSDDNSHSLIYRVLDLNPKVISLIFIKIKDDSYINMQVHFLKKQPFYA